MFSTKSYTRCVAVIALAFASAALPVHAAGKPATSTTSATATTEAGWMASVMRYWHLIWDGPTR